MYETLSQGVETVTDPKLFAEPMKMDRCKKKKKGNGQMLGGEE